MAKKKEKEVKAGRVDDCVKFEIFAAGANAVLCDLVNSAFADINQPHIVPIKCLEIAGVDTNAFGADWIAIRSEQFRSFSAINNLTDAFTHELCGCVIGGLI